MSPRTRRHILTATPVITGALIVIGALAACLVGLVVASVKEARR